MKKLVTLLLCFILVMTSAMAVGCTTPDNNSGKTTIYVFNANGGTGTQWLYNLEKRFEAEYAEKSYAEGKKGVNLKVNEALSDPLDNMASDGNNVYFVKQGASVSYAANGNALDITDWVTEAASVYANDKHKTLADKIDEDQLRWHTYDDKIYALPAETYLEGVSYDVELWEDNGLYLAPADDTAYSWEYAVPEYDAFFGGEGSAKIRLINYSDAPKSVGPDGEPNSADDGLPSSIMEFLCLCHYMKNDLSVSPVSVSGNYLNYSNHLVEDLWKQLAGERFAAHYNLEGEIEVVTGVKTNEYLFKSDRCSIPMPITEWVDVTEETGYLARDMVERYYANALVEILFKEGFFAQSTTYVDTVTHTMAQSAFISSGQQSGGNVAEKIAMHVDGGYWWQESTAEGNFEKYAYFDGRPNEDGQDRNIAWMSLPVQWSGSVTEEEQGNAHEYIGVGMAKGMCIVNANILDDKNSAEILGAVKDFVQFAYTDANLNEFTRTTGMPYNVDYDITDDVKEDVSAFYNSMIELLRGYKPDYNFNKSYVRAPGNYSFGLLSDYMGVDNKSSFLGALMMKTTNANTWAEFKEGSVDAATWEKSYYYGDK